MGKLRKTPRKSIASIASIAPPPPYTHCVSERGSGSKRRRKRVGYGESGGDTMAQNTPHDGKHYFPVWNRYAIRKYYTASSGEMSTPVLLWGV